MTMTINLFWIVVICAICLIAFLLHNFGSIGLFTNHDQKVIDKFLDKYPDVTELFCKMPLREQNIENNQEIHELNLITNKMLNRLDAIDKRLDELEAVK